MLFNQPPVPPLAPIAARSRYRERRVDETEEVGGTMQMEADACERAAGVGRMQNQVGHGAALAPTVVRTVLPGQAR